ncbi:MAG: hypothetical protein WAK08_22240, partial [Pseudolabrys sp.]
DCAELADARRGGGIAKDRHTLHVRLHPLHVASWLTAQKRRSTTIAARLDCQSEVTAVLASIGLSGGLSATSAPS